VGDARDSEREKMTEQEIKEIMKSGMRDKTAMRWGKY
jgi:hypothetical protein